MRRVLFCAIWGRRNEEGRGGRRGGSGNKQGRGWQPGGDPMSGRDDCIVVGGGHNGLVCATYLARGGRSVLVLEAAERVGGAAVTREFWPGFKVSAGAHLLHLMPEALIHELSLGTHGLHLVAQRMPTTAVAVDQAPSPIDAANPAALASRSSSDALAL